MLHTDRGRALAKMRRVRETLTAVGIAEDHFAHFNPDNDPPFFAYWNTENFAIWFHDHGGSGALGIMNLMPRRV